MFCLSDLYFLVLWHDDEDRMYDVISAKEVVIADGDKLALQKGAMCKALFKGKEYDAEVVGSGKLF